MSTTLFVATTTNVTDSNFSDEPYGPWFIKKHFKVDGVSLSLPEFSDYEEFTLPQEVKAGDHVYVLHMTYGSGDSFGEEEGIGEVIWVFPTHALASVALKLWDGSGDGSVEFDIGDGHSKKLHNPAWGYFESQESVDVGSFVVTN